MPTATMNRVKKWFSPSHFLPFSSHKQLVKLSPSLLTMEGKLY